MKCVLSFICILMIWGCSRKDIPELSNLNTTKRRVNVETPTVHRVLEILDRTAFREAAPPVKEISFEEYQELKAEYSRKNERWHPDLELVYRVKQGDSWRRFWLTLESFDENRIWLAELTQSRSKGWDWVARYVMKRGSEVDKEFNVKEILEERSKVIGGVKYGMSVTEVLTQKGKHYKVNYHAEGGSADIVYDDVTVSVRQWWPRNTSGRVIKVKPTTSNMKDFMKNIPYEDKK